MLKGSLAAALCALIPAAAMAQGADAGCFIQVQKIVAPAPAGIGELASAIHLLDEALRPQADGVNALRRELAALQQKQQAAASDDGSGAPVNLVKLEADIRRVSADLDSGQAALKAAYAAQFKDLVAPVQMRVGQRAQAFGIQHKCAAVKMARTPDIPALAAAGGRDITADFVAWYAANPR
ncbi:MAG: hypothetical protein RLZZ08_951 [Pseudomonadota bacterium]|jgi:Skp family chaperone for outer membrane proteins